MNYSPNQLRNSNISIRADGDALSTAVAATASSNFLGRKLKNLFP